MNNKARRDEIMETAADWCDRLETLSVEERLTLNRWLAADPEHARAYARMRQIMQDVALLDAVEAVAPVHPKNAHTAGFSWPSWLRSLASSKASYGVLVGAVAAACLVVYVRIDTPQAPSAVIVPAAEVYATATGQRQTVALADKSVAYLNADTRLTVAYSAAERHLTLSRGEAIFEVAKNKARPFRVQTDAATVTAVGTRFGVDRVGDALEVRVFEGTVKVEGKAASEAVTAGQWLLIDPARGVSRGTFSPDHYDNWRTGWLEADRMPLSYVVARIGRYTDDKIDVADPALASVALSGRFRLDSPDGTLKQIAALLDADIARHDHHIVLSRKHGG